MLICVCCWLVNLLHLINLSDPLFLQKRTQDAECEAMPFNCLRWAIAADPPEGRASMRTVRHAGRHSLPGGTLSLQINSYQIVPAMSLDILQESAVASLCLSGRSRPESCQRH